jgi:F-type H+-transporting ATPase subunit a
MPEHEIWLTALFNHYLAGVGNFFLSLVGRHAENPDKPWANFMTTQILVFVGLVVLFALLKPRLSVDRPGKLQHVFEMIYQFLKDTAEDVIGHSGVKYVGFFATLFIFILAGNLLGAIPTFESPTMYPFVTVGCAVAAFFYYNMVGVQAVGAGKYLKHFLGPVPALFFIMIPIEIISHFSRPLSLSVRLFANMYAGEMVTIVFLQLTFLMMPALFMGLHLFVALLQAYIFVLLTMVYVGGAVAEEH